MQGTAVDVAVRETVLEATRALVGLAARSLASVSDDVSLVQYRVLVILDGRGHQTMSQLAESLDVNASTATRVCARLVDKKLIRRFTPEDNRRTTCVQLTAKGTRLIDVVMTRRRRYLDEALARMRPESCRRLARSLSEFAEAAGELSDHAWTLGWSIGGEHAERED